MNEKATVYIVDDDQAILDSLKWLLESVEYNVDTFSSPVEFLEKATPTMCGCLLLDIRMREMDGIQLQERLRRRGTPRELH